MVRQLELPVEIARVAPPPTLLPFDRFFRGFERLSAVRKIFRQRTDEVIENLRVEFCTNPFGFMAVSHRDGHLIVSRWHLQNSDTRTLYLDLIHELFHVGQFLHERDAFLEGYERLVRSPAGYFRNPIEVAAYRHTVDEAVRIGMTHAELEAYLEVPWADSKSNAAFLRTIGVVRGRAKGARGIEVPVRINRSPPIVLRPFTDYFRGFGKVAGVRRLWGDDTEAVLASLQVEFSSHPLDYLRMTPDDGHLEISQWHLRDSDISLLYLDLFLYLQYVAQFLAGRWDAYAGYGMTFPALLDAIQKEDSEFREYFVRSAGFGSYDDFIAATGREGFGYQDIPMIIEAFRATVDEGRRIGMPEAELAAYAISPAGGPMTRDAQNRFYRNVGIRLNRDAGRKRGGSRPPP